MKCFRIETLGDTQDETRCVLDHAPDDLGVAYWRLCKGAPCAAEMPDEVRIRMSEDRDGLRLASLIGSTKSMLLVHKDVQRVIADSCRDNVEYFPFQLIDHKGRVHSDEYVIVNPLGTHDCLDYDASEIVYFKNTERVVSVKKRVLNVEKTLRAPALFRLKEKPTEYYVNDTLAEGFREAGFEGLIMHEVVMHGESEGA